MGQPNVLFLIVDQMQARVLEPGSACRTPNLDRLAARGIRFTRAYSPSPICSPSRASLMTGRYPHTHGVTDCTHIKEVDQVVLRSALPHWAQRLRDCGYRTGYFGKWHIERSGELGRFGWDTHDIRDRGEDIWASPGAPALWLDEPTGYTRDLLYGTTDVPPERRGVGVVAARAADFLCDALAGDEPWCCFVSIFEPHDPYVPGREVLESYDIDTIELPASVRDDLAGRPAVYRKSRRVFDEMTDRQHREAAACYYASITEVDAQYGRLIDIVEAAGRLEDTIVVFTSDHGEFLGAHGLYGKNVGAFDEAYRIPLIVAGPGIAAARVAAARVGLHEVAPTLCELTGAAWETTPGSRSFAPVLAAPDSQAAGFVDGFAEYEGSIFGLTQRVLWRGDWKLVWNGFDFDELYDLAADPHELHNRIDDPACRDILRELFAELWQRVGEYGDWPLRDSDYPPLRLATVGPAAG